MNKLNRILTALITVFCIALTPLTVSANKNSDLINDLNNYATNDENSDFDKVQIKGKDLIVYISDDYVETVDDYGLESYLQDTYKQVNKFQKKNNTKLSVVFRDKASGVFEKSSHSGKGWYKSLGSDGDKNDFNFKTGEVE